MSPHHCLHWHISYHTVYPFTLPLCTEQGVRYLCNSSLSSPLTDASSVNWTVVHFCPYLECGSYLWWKWEEKVWHLPQREDEGGDVCTATLPDYNVATAVRIPVYVVYAQITYVHNVYILYNVSHGTVSCAPLCNIHLQLCDGSVWMWRECVDEVVLDYGYHWTGLTC